MKVRIESDGTPMNTRFFSQENGEELKLYASHVSWKIDADSFSGAKIDVTLVGGTLVGDIALGFQDGVNDWMRECFTPAIRADKRERLDRLLEETLELAQSLGYDQSRVATLVDYVYNRPVGEPYQELGGVMVTLAALSEAVGLSMHLEGERELGRIWTKIPQIRAKQEAKRDIHGPLP